MSNRPVLVVDTFSGLNDYGVAMALSLAQVVPLTFLTVADTRIPPAAAYRLLADIPQWGGKDGKLKKLRRFIRYLAILVRELWRHRNGSVHVQLFRLEGVDIWIYLLMRPLLRKLVFSAHNIFPHELRWWHKPLYRLWYRVVDDIHVLGRYSARRLRDMGIPDSKIHFIPHGDYALFRERHPVNDAATIRSELGLTGEDVMVLFYGLIRDYKGLDRLVDAFIRLPPESKAFLVVAGGGDESQIDAASAALRAAGRLHRASLRFGFVPDAGLADLVSASDLVVFPYRHIYQSGALMLAMTYAKPVIASDIEGFRDYLEGHANGVLADTADTRRFGELLGELTGDPTRRAAMSAAAKVRCATEFAWVTIARQFADIYR